MRVTERELANLVERAYVGKGGTTFIHYIGVTSMSEPPLKWSRHQDVGVVAAEEHILAALLPEPPG